MKDKLAWSRLESGITDKKAFMFLKMKYGMAGLGYYLYLRDKFAVEDGCVLDLLSEDEMLLNPLEMGMSVDEYKELIAVMIDTCKLILDTVDGHTMPELAADYANIMKTRTRHRLSKRELRAKS